MSYISGNFGIPCWKFKHSSFTFKKCEKCEANKKKEEKNTGIMWYILLKYFLILIAKIC